MIGCFLLSPFATWTGRFQCLFWESRNGNSSSPLPPSPGPHEPNTFEEKQSRQRGYKFEHSLLFMNAGFLATDKRRHRRNPFKTKFGWILEKKSIRVKSLVVRCENIVCPWTVDFVLHFLIISNLTCASLYDIESSMVNVPSPFKRTRKRFFFILGDGF